MDSKQLTIEKYLKENSLNIDLDCSLNRFVQNGIPIEHAKIQLSYLIRYANRFFNMKLKTYNVFSKKVFGNEHGCIESEEIPGVYENEKEVEEAAICLTFLFFSNVLNTRYWKPTPRRGEHWDYSCRDENGKKIVLEIGGSTTKYGASSDQSKKRKRFRESNRKLSETIFISSVGFSDGDHIVSRYC